MVSLYFDGFVVLSSLGFRYVDGLRRKWFKCFIKPVYTQLVPSVRSCGRLGANSLSGGGSAGVALKPETRISGGERPQKHENKNKWPEIVNNKMARLKSKILRLILT